jgi:hypothetical protein
VTTARGTRSLASGGQDPTGSAGRSVVDVVTDVDVDVVVLVDVVVDGALVGPSSLHAATANRAAPTSSDRNRAAMAATIARVATDPASGVEEHERGRRAHRWSGADAPRQS